MAEGLRERDNIVTESTETMKAIEIDKAAFLLASGWKPEDAEIKPEENILTEQANEAIKALPKGKAKGVTLHLNRIADLLARSGQGNGNEDEDEDMDDDLLNDDWANQDGYPDDDSDDEAEEDEGGDTNMVTQLFGGNLPEPTRHSSDGTALFTVAQLEAHHNEDLSHSSPQKGESNTSKGRRVKAERFIKGATPSKPKQRPAAKDDNTGVLNDAGGSVGA